jgi:hypothetical protein
MIWATCVVNNYKYYYISIIEDVRRSALAKSWAAPDSFSDSHHDRPTSGTKSREYDRPWIMGSKTVKIRGEHTQSNKENTRQGTKKENVLMNSFKYTVCVVLK